MCSQRSGWGQQWDRLQELEQQKRINPSAGLVVEVASGTGQHISHFAAALAPDLQWQPSDVTDELFGSIRAYTGHQPNVLPPVLLDARWDVDQWPGGILSIYGPFKINNEFTTDSNRQFHETLVATNLEWGYRDVGDITKAASAAGLQQQQCVAMPANNYLLVYKKSCECSSGANEPNKSPFRAGRDAVKARQLALDTYKFPGLEVLRQRVAKDLELLAYPDRQWVQPRVHSSSGCHVFDVLIVGGGQCGLTTAFGLRQEQVTNVLCVDENEAGLEGPWVTYARMVTLRTNKALTGPDMGMASLTFRSFYEAKYGERAWESLDKIPKEEWMAYLIWYRHVLNIPVRNRTRVDLIEWEPELHGFKVTVSSTTTAADCDVLYARKVVLATGIQGGGEWHVPSVVRNSLPKALYAHTCQDINFASLVGKRVAILGGGASAFDNAQHALENGVGEVHVFVRRPELPRINPIRFMEFAGFLRHFSDLDDATKYAGIDFFMQFNQPPTNDTFNRAARFDAFHLHSGAPWEKVVDEGGKIRIFTPHGDEGLFDFAIISTGLLTDARLRPELSAVAEHIATWGDREDVVAPGQPRNALIDAHPYLGPAFEFQEKISGVAPWLGSLFAYNYSALPSLGLSGSALSGMKAAMPKLISGITRQLFLEDKAYHVGRLLAYDTPEFVQQWPLPEDTRQQLKAQFDGIYKKEANRASGCAAVAACCDSVQGLGMIPRAGSVEDATAVCAQL
eukprot:gene8627-8808_t